MMGSVVQRSNPDQKGGSEVCWREWDWRVGRRNQNQVCFRDSGQRQARVILRGEVKDRGKPKPH